MAVVDNMGLLCLVVDSGEGNRIEGRTKLQKIVYFCQYLGWDVNDYRLHYYGPFSFGLANTIKTVEDGGFVSQTGEPPHTFNITDKGREFLDAFKANVCDEARVKNTQRLVSDLSAWGKKDLELAATLDYVHKNNRGISKRDLLDKVDTIKSNFSRAKIEKAHDLWLNLKEHTLNGRK